MSGDDDGAAGARPGEGARSSTPSARAPAVAASPRVLPRASAALLEAAHGAAFVAVGNLVPLRPGTPLSLLAFAVGALHGAAALLLALRHRRAAVVWRARAFASLVFLAYVTYELATSVAYVASLYEGLGRTVAGVLGALWLLFAALTVPMSAWALASTGGVRPPRGGAGPVVAVVALLVPLAGVARWHRAARAEPVVVAARAAGAADAPPERRWSVVLAAWRRLPSLAIAPSLFTAAPIRCAASPSVAATALVAFADASGRPQARCVQIGGGGTEARRELDLPSAVAALLTAEAAQAPVKIDVVAAAQRLPSLPPLVAPFALRPGLDGIAFPQGDDGATCLTPWQLFASGDFVAFRPIPGVPDLRFGVSGERLRRAARLDAGGDLGGALRLDVESLLVDAHGELLELPRLRRADVAVDEVTLARSATAAERFVLDAQGADGRFAYSVQPFSGAVSYDNFSVARQAGTTAALCSLGTDEARVAAAARRSLEALAALEWRASGDAGLGAMTWPAGAVSKPLRLGPSALALVAVMTCRPRVGAQFDALAGRLARYVLALQRPDGGFWPTFDVATRRARSGPPPLYAEGEAILALLLVEAAAGDADGALPARATVRAAAERAMGWFADGYWRPFDRGLYYLEESWHCLAARAALSHHRHAGYERFCLDYVAFRSRFVLGPSSGVRRDFEGGFGFGNVVPPPNTPSASTAEAVAAAVAVRAARGEDTAAERATLERQLAFLLRQQWDEASCFACDRSRTIPGGFSEHMGAPEIRIDYVQHAWSAIGEGARALRGP